MDITDRIGISVAIFVGALLFLSLWELCAYWLL